MLLAIVLKGDSMKYTEDDLISFFLALRTFNFVGTGSVEEKDLQENFPDITVSKMSPFVDVESGICSINFAEVKGFLREMLSGVLTELCDLEFIKTFVLNNFQDVTLQPLLEVENSDHQSYRYLYEELSKKYNELNEEFHNQLYKFQTIEAELSLKDKELNKLKESGTKIDAASNEILDFIDGLLNKDIVISDAFATDEDGNKINVTSDKLKKINKDEISSRPAVYGLSRPSFFSEIKIELDQEAAAKKVVENTSNSLFKRLKNSKELKKMDVTPEEKANSYDLKRKSEILNLLRDDSLSNEEKYLKYILLSPGLSRDYMKTLDGAADLGLNANVVIMFLEQPQETFNKEIFEAYVSRAHKGNEYNLKQELAEDLINGKWSIVANVNGKPEKFQLIPFEMISKISIEFKNLYDAICGKNESQSILENIPESDALSTSLQENVDDSDEEADSGESLPNIDPSDFEYEDDGWGDELEERFSDFDKDVM